MSTFYKKMLIVPSAILFIGMTMIPIVHAYQVFAPVQGGTGIGTAPSYGQLLVGNSSGTYTLTATTSLGTTGVSNGGTGQTTFNSSKLLYGAGTGPIQSVSTSSASCSSGVSCSSFTVVGGVSPSITNSGVTSIVAGSNVTINQSTGAVTINASGGGGGGSPGGSNGQIQYNNNGSFGGITSVSVANGGTGAAAFGQGWLYSAGGTGALAASSSPTISSLYSTSTSQPSTFNYALYAAGGVSLYPPVRDGLVSYVNPSSGFKIGGTGNGNVIIWKDMTGNGNNFVADDQNAAPYNTAASGNYPGYGGPVAWRNGVQSQTSTRLVATTSASLNTQHMSVFVVFRPSYNLSSNNAGTTTLIASDDDQFQFNLEGGLINAAVPATQAIHVISGKTSAAIVSPFYADAGIQFAGFVGSTSAAEIFENTDSTTTKAFASDTVNGIWLGNDVTLQQCFSGQVYAVLVYNTALTDGQVEDLRRWAYNYFGLNAQGTANVVIAGDSETQGYGLNDPNAAWPTIIAEDQTKKVIDYGASGATANGGQWPSLIANAYNPNKKSVAVIWLGTNDISGGTSSTTLQTTLETLATDARNDGYKVAVATIIGRESFTAGQETIRQSVNADIINGAPTYWDAVVNLNQDSVLASTTGGGPTNLYYYQTDGTHLTESGQQVVAYYFNNAINSLLNQIAGSISPSQGGTGTTSVPVYGQVLVGNSNGTYTLTATSSLGIAGTTIPGNSGNILFSSGSNTALASTTGFSFNNSTGVLSIGGGGNPITLNPFGTGASGSSALINLTAYGTGGGFQGVNVNSGAGTSGCFGIGVNGGALICSDTFNVAINGPVAGSAIKLGNQHGEYGIEAGNGNGDSYFTHYFGTNINGNSVSNGGDYYNIGKTVLGTTSIAHAAPSIVPTDRLEINALSGKNYISLHSSANKIVDAFDQYGQLQVGTTTTTSLLDLGTNNSSTNGSTTISEGKIQVDGYNSAGGRICSFFVGTTLTTISGACNP